MQSRAHPPAWKILLAFALIYLVWGSSFLAIRLGVREIPPFLLASMRGLIGGLVLYGWTLSRGERTPTAREWASASLLGIMIFVFDYGLLFWAEQRVASGVAAVMMSMNAVFMAIFEILILRTQRLTARLALALLLGLAGVSVLAGHALRLGGVPIDRRGAIALLVASLSWSLASVLTRKLPLPHSKVMTSGMQMLAGGAFLAIVAASLGEFRNFHPSAVSHVAWLSLL
jgi:drug/metabolite transporter (DMT)-like permease